ncbi:asparagine synthase (glutamine-hydrolyzing) [Ruegeria sp.]|uniref:asparagine synthase (glutamine-hydrolyzing) n=1 Tax=Ruegeria sp. TaxID=1879320 RepID=UPI0023106C72|nr:asparagine synthase (glutamine-hydrolyzing) [Ruegeria sp.]MDA7964888.1 asparagine synthase (glutamine-hydrolyzing) [Ruegeria sp.]
MCGIAGWIGAPEDQGVLKNMTDAIAHRGPDGEGAIVLPLDNENVAALGHRRLSIIDLAGGTQPMESHDGRFTIVYNGEIYNFVELRAELAEKGAQFRTNSDTEVILEAWRLWGADGLARFRGMFAFALYDHADRSVTLARDPYGKKPLYLYRFPTSKGEGLLFASEIASLRRHPQFRTSLDTQSIYEYLCQRYVPSPNTFFQGVQKLRPGSYLRWNAGQIEEKRFWIPPEERGADAFTPPTNPVEEFLDVFDASVRLRMRSDVPVGAFLSSGLDSSAIVATLAHLGVPEIRTFSIGFQGDRKTELTAAEETANLLGAIHTPIELNTDQISEKLPELSRHRGAPMADSADFPLHMMSLEAAKHVKVVLSGEGSDELFGGYPKHLAEGHLGRMMPAGLLPLASRSLLAATSVTPVRARRLRIAANALKEPCFQDRMIRWFGLMSPAERAALWKGGASDRPRDPVPFNAAPGASALRRVLHFDQTSWLPDNLLERMDTMTMAASIEGRAPFMDARLAEFASSLPDHWRIKGRVTKRILRTAMQSRLPEAVLNRPKIGFRMPVAEWFQGPLYDPLCDLMSGSGSVSANYLDAGQILQQAKEHRAGQADHSKTLWAVYALETFLQEFF